MSVALPEALQRLAHPLGAGRDLSALPGRLRHLPAHRLDPALGSKPHYCHGSSLCFKYNNCVFSPIHSCPLCFSLSWLQLIHTCILFCFILVLSKAKTQHTHVFLLHQKIYPFCPFFLFNPISYYLLRDFIFLFCLHENLLVFTSNELKIYINIK